MIPEDRTKAPEEYLEEVSVNALKDAVDRRVMDGQSMLLRESELEYIRERRRRAGLETENLDSELIGLALSGGGIRSATFGLGVMQALAHKGVLERIDYLSTVSGGGYIGSSLTWWLNQNDSGSPFGLGKDDFPYGTDDPSKRGNLDADKEQQTILKYLRQRGKYLTPGDGITLASGIAVVLRGMMLNLLVWLPFLTLLFLGLASYGSGAPHDTPTLFAVLLWLFVIGTGILIFANVVYSLCTLTWLATGPGTLHDRLQSFFERWAGKHAWLVTEPGNRRYVLRRFFERWAGLQLGLVVGLLVVGSLPHVENWVKDYWGAEGLTVAGAISGIWAFFNSPKDGRGKLPFDIIGTVGALILIYGVLLLAYSFGAKAATHDYGWLMVGSASCVALLTGIFVNLNYISLHRFYRDRLMEAFLPDRGYVASWAGDTEGAATVPPARLANAARLSGFGNPESPRGPYHIINANLILTGSAETTRKIRGGDSFILSPLYCGGNASGWISTRRFVGGDLTLATAMAISGAAANPNTGAGGTGLTRNPVVSLLMEILNISLGYWVRNPRKQGGRPRRPNHFMPGFTQIWGHKASNEFLQLSDGGHFENLGIYELIRRRTALIIACDAGADPTFAFSDLQTAVRRIGADFGAKIRLQNNQLEELIPRRDAGYPQDAKLARTGHLFGKIEYVDGTEGDLIFLKTTMIPELKQHLEVMGYKGANPLFPDQSTADQFFDEEQFEAYRELGYEIASAMLAAAAGNQIGKRLGLQGMSSAEANS